MRRLPCSTNRIAVSAAHVLGLAVLALGLVAPASARTIEVTTTLDNDAAPASECTLRDAISAANDDAATGGCKAGKGKDRIELAKGATYILSVAGTVEDDNVSGDIDIWGPLDIHGMGATIDAGGLDRVLHVQPPRAPADAPTSVSVNSLSITGGDGARFGGGVRIDGPGSLALRSSRIHDNRAAVAGGGLWCGFGGSTCVLHDSTVDGNVAAGAQAGGIGTQDARLEVNDSWILGNRSEVGGGGGLSCSFASECTISDSTISENSAPFNSGGGGAVGDDSQLELVRTTVSDNTSAVAGGIFCGTSSGTSLDIDRSTINGNTAIPVGAAPRTGVVGGVFVFSGCSAVISNSTVSGNSATGNPAVLQGIGGGIATAGETAAARLELINVTVAGNSATLAGGIATFILAAPGAGTETIFENSIVAGNSAVVPGTSSCFKNSPAVFQTSLGHNLEDSATCEFIGPGDQILTDPLLAGLADNGGPTWTQALLEGSPAIDAADDLTCAGSPIDGRDQRGVKRSQRLGCDIGAFERREKDD